MFKKSTICKASQAFVIAASVAGTPAVEAKDRGDKINQDNLKCDKLIKTGTASWYKSGHRNANGERFVASGVSIAHPSLPFGTMVKIESIDAGVTGSVIAPVKDRGPFIDGRIVDLSSGAADRMPGFKDEGTPKVRLFKCVPH